MFTSSLDDQDLADLDAALQHLHAVLEDGECERPCKEHEQHCFGPGFLKDLPVQERLAKVTASDFPLSPRACGRVLGKIRYELERGRGVVLFQLPTSRYSHRDLALLFVGLGAHLGVAKPQSTELQDVLGQVTWAEGRWGIRGYRNRAPQRLHTDGGVDIVGMLCVRPASDGGGVSRYSSGVAAYNDLLKSAPEALPILFKGFRYHLGEHFAVKGSEGPVLADQLIPVLQWGPEALGMGSTSESLLGSTHHLDTASGPLERRRGSCLRVHYLRRMIDDAAIALQGDADLQLEAPRGSERPKCVQRDGVRPHSPEVQSALDAWHSTLDANAVELAMRPGEVCFFNNKAILHGRSGFDDPERLLLRLWLNVAPPTSQLEVSRIAA